MNPVLRGLCIHPAPRPAQYSRFVVHLKLERVSGNDPPYQRWQRRALPLSYTRVKSPVLSARDRGASTGLTRTNTLFAASRRTRTGLLASGLPSPGAPSRCSLPDYRPGSRLPLERKLKNKNPAHHQVSGVSKILFRVPTRLPPELVPPYYGHTMTTEQTIPYYEGYTPSSGRLDL